MQVAREASPGTNTRQAAGSEGCFGAGCDDGVALYPADANRKRMADAAIARLSRWEKQMLAKTTKPRRGDLKIVQCPALVPRLGAKSPEHIDFKG